MKAVKKSAKVQTLNIGDSIVGEEHTVVITEFKGRATFGVFANSDIEKFGDVDDIDWSDRNTNKPFPKFACQVAKAKLALAHTDALQLFVDCNDKPAKAKKSKE